MTKPNELRAQVEELEQKATRKAGADEADHRLLGQQFVESKGFKDLAESPSQRGKADMQLKATITLATTDTLGAAGDTVQVTRVAGIVAPPSNGE